MVFRNSSQTCSTRTHRSSKNEKKSLNIMVSKVLQETQRSSGTLLRHVPFFKSSSFDCWNTSGKSSRTPFGYSGMPFETMILDDFFFLTPVEPVWEGFRNSIGLWILDRHGKFYKHTFFSRLDRGMSDVSETFRTMTTIPDTKLYQKFLR